MLEAPIKFWSFSAVKKSEACPHAVYLQRVVRSPRPVLPEDNPLMRGIRVHKEAELFVKGEGELTRDLTRHHDRLEEMKARFEAGHGEVEESWWFDREWKPVSYENPDKWCVVVTDFTDHVDDTTIRISDFKTGKSFGKEIPHGEQGQLYGLAGFMRYPNVNVVEVEFIYLDEKKTTLRKFDRTKVPPLLDRWTKRGERLVNMRAFPHKANKSNCKYCDFGPNNGGTNACPYGVEV